MADIVLRNYQDGAIERMGLGIREGHRCQIIMAPCGAGKSLIATELLRRAHRKMSRAIFVCDRVALIDQFSAMLDNYGVPHGVIQASHPKKDKHAGIQVCSAQTIERRGFFPGMLDLVIIDEVHDQRKLITQFVQNTTAKVLGLSASPFTKGLGKTYTNLINVVTTNQLIREGWLVPLKIYAAKAADMTGAKTIGGEWSDDEVEKRGTSIMGDIVTEWRSKTKLHFGGKAKTIVFVPTVAYGEELCRQFNACGYNFRQCSYMDSDTERREKIAEFRKPDSVIDGLVAVDVFTKGFDCPDVRCLVDARPLRKSFAAQLQKVGRVMRPSPGKEYGLLLCHAGNAQRWYKDFEEVFEHGLDSLDDGKKYETPRKEPTEREKKERVCSCGFILPPTAPACPACGKERTRRSLVETLPGELVEFAPRKTAKPEPPLPLWTRDRDRTYTQLCGYGMQRKKGDVAAAKRWAAAQYKQLFDAWPTQPFNPTAPPHIDFDLKGRVLANTIRWAKGRGRAMKEEVRAMNLGKE